MDDKQAARLGFSAESTSADDGYPVQELQHQSQHTKGWQSEKLCLYPQEILLRFDGFVRIKQLQILSHEFKICRRMEIHVGVVTSETDEEENIDWKLLGTLTFDANEKSGFLARELKRVQVTAEGDLLKFTFIQCHTNKLNTYNQVGIVTVDVLGEELMDFPPRVGLQHEIEVGLDPASKQLYQKLMRLKDIAVKNEDYDEAKRLKIELENLRSIGQKLAKLELEKKKAVEIEDYDLAKCLKQKIFEIRSNRATEADSGTVPEHQPELFGATIDQSSAPPLPAEPLTSDQEERLPDASTPDGSVDVSPEHIMRTMSLGSLNGRTKHDEYDNRIAKAQGTYNHHSTEAPEPERAPAVANHHLPDGFPQDLPPPEQISAANAKASVPLEQFAGTYIAQCFYSRQWQLREAALRHLELYYENLIQEGMEREQHRLLCQVIRRGLQDKVANVFLTSTSFIQTLITGGNLADRDVQFATSDFLPILVDKLGDTNPRIKDASQESILRLAKLKESGIKSLTSQFLRPPKKPTAWRPLLGRLELINELIDVVGISKQNSGGFEIDQLMPFVSRGFLSPNAEARSCALNLIVKLAQIVGLVVKRYIPTDINPKVRQQIDLEIADALSNSAAASPQKITRMQRNQHRNSPSTESQLSPGSLGSEMDDPKVFELEIQRQEQLVGQNHPDLCEPLNSLALIYNQRKEYDLALPLLKRVLEISEQHHGADHSNVADALTDLALLHVEKNEEEKARPLLTRALAIQEKNLGPDHPDVEVIRNVLTPADDS